MGITKRIRFLGNGVDDYFEVSATDVNGDVSTEALSRLVREGIIKALNGGEESKCSNLTMQSKNWSNFGLAGDTIKVEDIETHPDDWKIAIKNIEEMGNQKDIDVLDESIKFFK